MASLIEFGMWYVVREGAPELIKEVPAYSWDPAEALKGIDAPIKRGDHGLDGGRYIIRTSRPDWYSEIFPDVLEETVALH